MFGSMKMVLQLKNFCLRYECMEYLQFLSGDFAPHGLRCRRLHMSNILKVIQQALEAIRIETEQLIGNYVWRYCSLYSAQVNL